METFSALLAICAGNSPVPGEFPAQRPVTRSFDVFFDLRLNKRLSKQSGGWWFETLPRSLWRHCNGISVTWPYIHKSANSIITKFNILFAKDSVSVLRYSTWNICTQMHNTKRLEVIYYPFPIALERIRIFLTCFACAPDIGFPCQLKINLDTKEFSNTDPFHYIITALYMNIINYFISWREYHVMLLAYV